MALELKEYIKGEGADLSKNRIIDSGKHCPALPDNLYSLKKEFEPESLDFIFMEDIDETKFHRILLKEMITTCKVGGNIIIRKRDGLLSFDKLVEEASLCIGKKAEMTCSDKKEGLIVMKKVRKILKDGDSMDKWTFGIITGGKKNDWVEMQIKSIRMQKIPYYEIIVCGTYYDRNEEDFKYIPFNEKDEKGWITRKKNLICGAARYENIVVLHDRIVLDEDWYKCMIKYGNYFEVLSCKVHNDKEERCGDWITYGNQIGSFPKIGMLEYKDWDRYGYLDGALYIMKKSAWETAKWDENLFWNEGEDIKLSNEWHKNGVVIRLNPHCSCLTLNWRHGALPLYIFDSKESRYPRVAYKMLIPMAKFYIKKVIGWK